MFFSTRAIAVASIRAGILQAIVGSCGPMLMPASMISMQSVADPARLPKRHVRVHGRRMLGIVLADVAKAPLAIEAVRRIDAIFDVEREINGLSVVQRHAIRHTCGVAPLVASLEQLDARRARQALAPCRGREGHGLYAQALAGLHALSRRWSDLSDEQLVERGLRGAFPPPPPQPHPPPPHPPPPPPPSPPPPTKSPPTTTPPPNPNLSPTHPPPTTLHNPPPLPYTPPTKPPSPTTHITQSQTTTTTPTTPHPSNHHTSINPPPLTPNPHSSNPQLIHPTPHPTPPPNQPPPHSSLPQPHPNHNPKLPQHIHPPIITSPHQTLSTYTPRPITPPSHPTSSLSHNPPLPFHLPCII